MSTTPKKSVSLIVEKEKAGLNNIPLPIIGCAIVAAISLVSFVGSRPTPLQQSFQDAADEAQLAGKQTRIANCESQTMSSTIFFEDCMNGVVALPLQRQDFQTENEYAEALIQEDKAIEKNRERHETPEQTEERHIKECYINVPIISHEQCMADYKSGLYD